MINLQRLLLFVFFMGWIPFSGYAQRFQAGILAGVSATQISGDQLGGFDKAGMVAGGMVKTALSENFDLGMEIIYFQKGSKKNSDPEKGDYTYYRLRLNYFEVPVLLQWKQSPRFTFEIGPTLGALLSQDEEDEFGTLPGRREFNSIEIGIAGGLKVNFAKTFSFISRLSGSVLPVREHVSGATYRFNRGQYNAALFFGLQYTFRKKDNG